MKIAKSVSWAKNCKETVIINTQSHKCLIVDEFGLYIWENLIETFSVEKTVVNLLNKFPNSNVNKIRNDVIEFYNLLISNDIIEE